MDKYDKLLLRVGIPAHVKGYRYTKAALKLLEEDPSRIDAMTKRLYPEVAQEVGSTASRVERAIRHGVERAFDRMPPELQEELFGSSALFGKGKASNGEFLAVMRLHLEEGTA